VAVRGRGGGGGGSGDVSAERGIPKITISGFGESGNPGFRVK
jgi:hypothetical protein